MHIRIIDKPAKILKVPRGLLSTSNQAKSNVSVLVLCKKSSSTREQDKLRVTNNHYLTPQLFHYQPNCENVMRQVSAAIPTASTQQTRQQLMMVEQNGWRRQTLRNSAIYGQQRQQSTPTIQQ